MRYAELVLACLEQQIPTPCPSCFEMAYVGHLFPVNHILPLRGGALDALSYREPQNICQRCQRMENLMRYMDWTIDLALAPAYQDWAEAIRLPEGVPWGTTRYPTGGYDKWVEWSTRLEAVLIELAPDRATWE